MMIFAFIVIVASCQVSYAKLQADFRVKTYTFTIEFSQASAGSVTATLKETDYSLAPQLRVDILPKWVDFSVKEPCSGLGDSILDGELTWETSQKSFTIPKDLADLEGRSIILADGCASIWNPDATYRTAVAKFSGQMAGAVYFRRADGDSSTTVVVSDFGWDGTPGSLAWKISDNLEECTSSASLFNPGNLTALLGAPSAGVSKTDNKPIFYRKANGLLLDDSSGSIVGKHVIVYSTADTSKVACAKIYSYVPREATTIFSHQGISGHISFSQASPFDPTQTQVDLKGLNRGAKGYHVHLYPVPIQEENGQDLCGGSVVAGHFDPYGKGTGQMADETDDQYEIGDLSSKYEPLTNMEELKKTYEDWNLPLFGKNSIIGRSVVIHRNDNSNSRWVCSNILLTGDVKSAVAIFKYPIYGHIYFTQDNNSAYSDTWIFAHLSYLEDDQPSSDLDWSIQQNMVGADMTLTEEADRCKSTGASFDPLNGEVCTQDNADNRLCKIGDLKAKHGQLPIGKDADGISLFTDTFLPLNDESGEELVILGKSVIIKSASNSILACATIQELRSPRLTAEVSKGQSISFSQQPGFGQRPTTVDSQFDDHTNVRIYTLPPDSDGNSECSDIGGVYNPLGVSASTTASSTHDQYKVGMLSRLDSSGTQDLNLPLTGPASIRHRTLVVTDSNSNVISCGIIQDPFSTTFGGYQVKARVVFSAPLEGYIDLFQTLFDDLTTTDTSVVVKLKETDGTMTENHNWHVHEKMVSGDSNATTGRCSSTGPHYDPFSAKLLSGAVANYGTYCSKTNPLRCELGDQAMKLGTYSLGKGKVVYTDVDLPLNGLYKVQGRSIVVHNKDKGAPRHACADIYPISDQYLVMEFVTPTPLDLTAAITKYSDAISGLNPEDIVIQVVGTDGANTQAHVHFLGNSREFRLSNFKKYFSNEANREAFGDYAPLETPKIVDNRDNKAAGGVQISLMLLTVAVLINTLVFQKW